MNYRVTCLTPTVVGDGRSLSPIDYMIWKDQVNVLDQQRIFKLLSRGPRLDGYLQQLKRSEKLEFASWGGFAQNFAGRRIPFEHASSSAIWDKARAENLFIPLFARGLAGAYLPGSALKGALRTAVLFHRWSPEVLQEIGGRMQNDRTLRHPGEAAGERMLGPSGVSRMKAVAAADSQPIADAAFKVYLTRVSTLVAKAGNRLDLGWKLIPRGSSDGMRPDESTPTFVEMAAPGTAFEGKWEDKAFFHSPEILRALRWREAIDSAALCQAAAAFSEALLGQHLHYAETAGLARVKECVTALMDRAKALSGSKNACVIPLGWGGGLASKSGVADTTGEAYRDVAKQISLFSRALQTGLPFPKTRRVLFLGNQPAALPGWAMVEFA